MILRPAATIGGSFIVGDDATGRILGGTIEGDLIAADTSQIFMSGGIVKGRGIVRGHASINYSGGALPQGGLFSQQLTLADTGTSEDPLLSFPGFTAYDDGIINIVGFNLVSTLVDANYDGGFSQYAITGTFGDGTPLSDIFIYLQNPTPEIPSTASFNLVEAPEPASLSLLVAAGALMIRRRVFRPTRD
jgi:hypothetical protein